MPFTRDGERFQGYVGQESNTNVSFIVFSTLEKIKAWMKNMLLGIVPVYDLNMLWTMCEKVWLMSLDTLHKLNHHRGSGFMVSKEKSPTVKGNPHFLYRLSLSILYS
jgi:hypothetical protein